MKTKTRWTKTGMKKRIEITMGKKKGKKGKKAKTKKK